MAKLSDIEGKRTKAFDDWRVKTLTEFRQIIKAAVPKVVEEVKWRKPSNSMLGVPVWSHNGIICTGETYQDKIKFTFAKGALLNDPAKLFNSSLEGKVRRAIDLHYGDKLNKTTLKALIIEAVAMNNRKK